MPYKRKRSFSYSRRTRARYTNGYGVQTQLVRRSKSARRMAKKSVARSRLSRLNVHSFMRWGSRVSNSITATDQTYSKQFTFGDVINPAEFSALYDRYMITKVVFEIQLVNNIDNGLQPNSVAASKSNFFPRMWYCRDYDDAAAETLDELKQRAQTKSFVLMPNKVYRIALKPAILQQVYRTAVTTGYEPKWNCWIDMAQTDVPHYGLKWCMDTHGLNPDDADYFQYDTTVKMYFKCKDVR